jgi:hypothetical protein
MGECLKSLEKEKDWDGMLKDGRDMMVRLKK